MVCDMSARRCVLCWLRLRARARLCVGLCASLGACCAFLLVLSVLSANQQVLGTRGSLSAVADKRSLLCSKDCARLSSRDFWALTVKHAIQSVLLVIARHYRLSGST